MLESTLVTMGWAVSNWLIAGVRPEPMGNENMTASPSGAFKTADGLINIAANQQQQFEKLCELIGRKELAADRRFVNREDRKKLRHELKAEIEMALAAKPAKEWAALLNQERRAGRRSSFTFPEVLDHPQITAASLIERFPRARSRSRDCGRPRGLPSGKRQSGTRHAAARSRRRHGNDSRRIGLRS